MRTIAQRIYAFAELSPEAKERAISDAREHADVWPWDQEAWESAQAFCGLADMRLDSADYWRGDISARYIGDDDIGQLSGLRAWKWLENNDWFDLAEKNASGECTLTGFHLDCPLFDPIAACRKTPTQIPEVSQLFDDCLQSWVFACRLDLEYSQSDEAVAENLSANGCEYYESGAEYREQ